MSTGYRSVTVNGHPRASSKGRLFEHILVAEKALGKYIPLGVVIHHVNEDRLDNRPENLVICENDRYHKLLHVRMRIIAAGGDPALHKICYRCKALKLRQDFCFNKLVYDGIHPTCRSCQKVYKDTHRRDRRKKVA